MVDQTAFVTSDGARLLVRALGANGDSLPVIALHGAPGLHSHAESAAMWEFLAQSRRVFVYDARGSGSSDRHPPLSHEQWTRDLEEIRRSAGVDRFVLAGHSYGGFVALEYALRYPTHVAALILQDTAASGKPLIEHLSRVIDGARPPLDQDRLRRLLAGTLTDDKEMAAALADYGVLFSFGEPSGGIAPPPVTAFHLATHNFAFSQNLPEYDVLARLQEIRCPTLVIVGGQDKIAPVTLSESIAGALANAELRVIDEARHTPALETPEAFRSAVKRFLAQLSR
jgi:proline iminopeptidase